MAEQSPLSATVGTQDLAGLRRLLARDRRAIPARAVLEAGRLVWQPGLALLKARGADLNASYKNYRAMHALLQERPHEDGSSTRDA